MRSLTIGALIVCGGTIAALPFRRDAAVETPAAPASGLITIPMSELAITSDSVPYDPWFVDSDASHRAPATWNSSRTSPATSLASQSAPSPALQTLRGIPSSAQPQPRRDLHLPLTYDDLAVPLTTTHFRDGRFNALANRQSVPPRATSSSANNRTAQSDRQYEAMRISADPPSDAKAQLPPWQMASDLPQSILQTPAAASVPAAAQADRPASPHAVVGRLASDTRPREHADAPQSETARERHWIRQPD